ncbi:MAG: hypothetical protein IJG75_03115 [Spirochaetia bacterium]|nr:hypothetical protein [Spirochaetia bacterium]
MKKIIIAVLLTALVIGNAAAIEITFGDIPDNWPAGSLPQEVQDAIREKVQDRYGKYEKGDELGRAFSNSNALAANSGYMHTANGYKWITVAVSTNEGVALDGISFNKFNDEFLDDFKEDGDGYMGAGIQMVNAAIGFNIGSLLKWDHGLYLTLKAGMTKFKYEDFKFDGYNMGFMVNYQLIEAKGLGKGHLLKWRGLDVGAGFTYFNTTTKFTIDELDTIDIDNAGGSGYNFKYDADLNVKAEMSRCIIPVEISTGIKLTVLEIFGGIGADFMFGGKSDFSLKSTGKVSLEGYDNTADSGLKMESEGDLDTVKFKFNVGIGLSLGPVRLEIPYTQYFDEKYTGSIGIIGGVAF